MNALDSVIELIEAIRAKIKESPDEAILLLDGLKTVLLPFLLSQGLLNFENETDLAKAVREAEGQKKH